MSTEQSIDQGQRSYFWFSVSLGIFVGLLFGFAISSIVSTVKLHEARARTAAERAQVAGMMRSQIERGHFGKAPTFSGLTNQNGRQVSSADLAGKVQVVSFLAPYGMHTTPVLVSHLMNLYQELAQSHLLGSKVVFVSYNLDPQHAGSDVMARFMREIAGLGPEAAGNWEFLTGDESTIGGIAAGRYAVQYHALTAADEAEYARQMKQQGLYDYAEAANPLAQNAPVHPRIVGHDEIFLVSPKGDIKLRITQADAYPSSRLLYDIVSLLNLPGMDKKNGG